MRAGRRANERELRVIAANDRIPGAVFRYTELDGDIGFVVGGGGASLFQHDLMLKMGAKPANHLDATPGAGWDEKMGAVIDAILDKISQHGIHSLTDEEKKFLEKQSKKLSRRVDGKG